MHTNSQLIHSNSHGGGIMSTLDRLFDPPGDNYRGPSPWPLAFHWCSETASPTSRGHISSSSQVAVLPIILSWCVVSRESISGCDLLPDRDSLASWVAFRQLERRESDVSSISENRLVCRSHAHSYPKEGLLIIILSGKEKDTFLRVLPSRPTLAKLPPVIVFHAPGNICSGVI